MPQWPFHSSHQFWRINIRDWSPCSALYLALLWICSEVLSLLQLQEGGFSKVGSHLNGLIGVIGKPVIGEDTLHLKNVNCRLKSAQLSILSPDSYQVGLTALAPVDVCSCPKWQMKKVPAREKSYFKMRLLSCPKRLVRKIFGTFFWWYKCTSLHCSN